MLRIGGGRTKVANRGVAGAVRDLPPLACQRSEALLDVLALT
jgi:hypothetical protein